MNRDAWPWRPGAFRTLIAVNIISAASTDTADESSMNPMNAQCPDPRIALRPAQVAHAVDHRQDVTMLVPGNGGTVTESWLLPILVRAVSDRDITACPSCLRVQAARCPGRGVAPPRSRASQPASAAGAVRGPSAVGADLGDLLSAGAAIRYLALAPFAEPASAVRKP